MSQSNVEIEETQKKEGEKNCNNRKCGICNQQENLNLNLKIAKWNCGHKYCISCLEQLIADEINKENYMQYNCQQQPCDQHIDQNLLIAKYPNHARYLKQYINVQIKEKFQNKQTLKKEEAMKKAIEEDQNALNALKKVNQL